MAVFDLEYSKHWDFKVTHANDWRNKVAIDSALKPEISNWLAQHKMRHTLVKTNGIQICILDNRQAMLFKLRWL